MDDYDGYLDLHDSDVPSLPEGMKVRGSLNLQGSSIVFLPDSLAVGDCLYLSGTPITVLPSGLMVGGGIDMSGTGITSLPGDLLVGGSLYLFGTPVTSIPEGLVVGGTLDLRNTPITVLPHGLVVGGHLDLRGTGVESLPDDLLVGGNILMPDGNSPDRDLCRLKSGAYVPGKYIFVDGILTHVGPEERLDGYTAYIGKIPDRNVVTDGKRYARCDRIRDGIADLVFMSASERGAAQYKKLPLDTEMSVDEARAMYRVITGFCRRFTNKFIVGSEDGGKNRYTVRELLDMTGGHCVHKPFCSFFGKWKPPTFGDPRACAVFSLGSGNGGTDDPHLGLCVKNLTAQEDLWRIAHALERRGYTVEAVEALQGAFVQYMIFYKSGNEILVVESSDTSELDEYVSWPETYFHFGCFGKCYNSLGDGNEIHYSPWFATGAKADDAIKNLDAIIGKVLSRCESDTEIRNEFKKWKLNRRCIRIGG